MPVVNVCTENGKFRIRDVISEFCNATRIRKGRLTFLFYGKIETNGRKFRSTFGISESNESNIK
ncbi:hypothetical protein LEP1GSC036_4148 [Leptospira weilii str. 2006001853]|uniref:Uncharacterized protein n=1 Tax=Leptospira weilii str. 2006001853 TaxID=1001589 RepID=A0A828YYK3_9LEPT|nr:hypothetical protein LEP1GSC036_4148 [Leptospira weilii str. 2006001853]